MSLKRTAFLLLFNLEMALLSSAPSDGFFQRRVARGRAVHRAFPQMAVSESRNPKGTIARDPGEDVHYFQTRRVLGLRNTKHSLSRS